NMECGGKRWQAKRDAALDGGAAPKFAKQKRRKSGVALRLPPHSIAYRRDRHPSRRQGCRRSQGHSEATVLKLAAFSFPVLSMYAKRSRISSALSRFSSPSGMGETFDGCRSTTSALLIATRSEESRLGCTTILSSFSST